MVELRNPVPFTVSVNCPEPAVTEVGLMEVTVGAGAAGVVVVPPEFEEEPPQPVRRVDARRQAAAEAQIRRFMRLRGVYPKVGEICSDGFVKISKRAKYVKRRQDGLPE